MRIVVPNKGRLHEPMIELLERAGLRLDNSTEYKPYAGIVGPDVTMLFARTVGIPEYVRDGAVEVGITGLDQVRESGHELEDLLDLEYGKYRLVLTAPEDGDIETVADVSGKVVTTKFLYIARTCFEEEDIDTEVVEVTGTTELTPYVEMADATIDITSTGTTLRMNRFAVIDETLLSSAQLFAYPNAVDDPKVQQLLMVLESVQSTGGKRYLMMSTPREKLDKVKEVIPDPGGPTMMDIVDDSTIAIHAVVSERGVFEVVNDLKNVDASGILVTGTEWLVE